MEAKYHFYRFTTKKIILAKINTTYESYLLACQLQ